jgi:hypothetical protein
MISGTVIFILQPIKFGDLNSALGSYQCSAKSQLHRCIAMIKIKIQFWAGLAKS